ncbi:hypothetical protein TNCV_2280431 [Trichonephila clavipes]|nr:hypothetical protein TNCV_2280431 [Trichonephila clavipes]
MTDSIPDKTTVPCKQSDDTNLLTDVKPTVSRHGRLVKKPQMLPGLKDSRIYPLSDKFDEKYDIAKESFERALGLITLEVTMRLHKEPYTKGCISSKESSESAYALTETSSQRERE